ncbi:MULTISPECIES: hypothetical protein [Nocardioides]|uniref:ARB-07466-like C-terminal domain-containing protein n=1 Tax=Nocardioides kribbensis TaxID=305517 RepID=A0ABV1P3I5_9ACTN|nr:MULTISPECIES: hypothetical protein [Nocardioides]KQP66518.1 hypothetical protein ASF47_01605 [Nocardioides sp. Leaf285]MBJ7530485.1 hypothetical protein [Nocardioides sp.]MCM3514341.1 hypothetical protein [Nocardioides sp. P86]
MRTSVIAAGSAVAALGVVGAVGYGVYQEVAPSLDGDTCVATVDGRSVELSVEQAENASLIVATAVRRGMPARAASIALATAYQESKIVNIDYGDRDSVGLFQQRPSQGWGTVEQILDPTYATNAFYDELEEVDGYESMEITVAAQAVQRSAFPDAYADHEDDARVIASALTGNSPAAFTCESDDSAEPASDTLGDNGLVARAERVRRDVDRHFGRQAVGGFAPGGVSTGHMEGSAHYEGRAVDLFYRPVNPTNLVRGWAVAQYLVAQAERLDVATVIYDAKIWTSGRADEGWRDYTPDTSGRSPETAAILEHRDHVHVDVLD